MPIEWTLARTSTRSAACIVVLALAIGADHPRAAERDWFVAANATVGHITMKDSDHGGGIGTGAAIDGFVDGKLDDSTTTDYSNGLGLATGFDSGPWRLEAELIWRYRSDWDLSVPTPTIGTVTNVFTNFSTTTVFLNAMRRGQLGSRWQWEAGLGAGVVRKVLDGEYIERGVAGVRPEFIFTKESTATDFGWHALAGLSLELGTHWAARMRYRYADLGDLKVGPYPQRNVRVRGELLTHELTLGIERSL